MEGEFDRFYRRNFGKVLSYFYAMTGSVAIAKRLSTETFARIGGKERGGSPPPLSRSSLFAIARAVRIEHLEPAGPSGATSEEDTQQNLQDRDLAYLTSRLDPLAREILSLRFDAGLTYGEISEMVGLTRAETGRCILNALRGMTAASQS